MQESSASTYAAKFGRVLAMCLCITCLGVVVPNAIPMVGAGEDAPEYFPFEDYDGYDTAEEAVAAALAELNRRFPIGSQVTDLVRAISRLEEDRGGDCILRYSEKTQENFYYCRYSHRLSKDPDRSYIIWRMPVFFNNDTGEITEIRLKAQRELLK